MSKCPKCDGMLFRIQEAAPSGSNFKLMFVQCSMCQCVVGVMDYYNIGKLMLEQNKALNAIASAVGTSVHLTT